MKHLQANVIETVVLALANGKKKPNVELVGKKKPTQKLSQRQVIARLIMDEMSTKQYPDSATDSIQYAIYLAALRNCRLNQLQEQEHKDVGATGEFRPELWDIAFYGFVQNIMDACCWAGRRGNIARAQVSLLDAELLGGNGQDFADGMSEELGIDCKSKENVAEDMQQIFKELSYVSAKIADKCGINSDPLYMFNPSTQLSDGTWVNEMATNSWDSTLSLMDDITANLKGSSRITNDDLLDFDISGMGNSVDHSQAIESITDAQTKFEIELDDRKAKAIADGIEHGAVTSVKVKRRKTA